MEPSIQALHQRCQLLAAQGELGLASVSRLLQEVPLDDAGLARAGRADPSHPYGRNVLFQDATCEAMLATWTRGVACAPHDHGGSVGGVLVLGGAARHRLYRVDPEGLRLVHEERVGAGEVLRCGPDLVHAMADDGDPEPLRTLHLYAGPISKMTVYDLSRQRTLVVDGGCGAWVPEDAPELIRAVYPGLVEPAQIPA